MKAVTSRCYIACVAYCAVSVFLSSPCISLSQVRPKRLSHDAQDELMQQLTNGTPGQQEQLRRELLQDYAAPKAVEIQLGEVFVFCATNEVLALQFRHFGSKDEESAYVWRSLDFSSNTESNGCGRVHEKYESVPLKSGVHLLDAGSELEISVGRIRLEWSYGSSSSGWLYFTSNDVRLAVITNACISDIDMKAIGESGDSP